MPKYSSIPSSSFKKTHCILMRCNGFPPRVSDQCRPESFPSASGSLGVTDGDFDVLGGQSSQPSAGSDGRNGRGRSSQLFPRGHETSHAPPAEFGATEYVTALLALLASSSNHSFTASESCLSSSPQSMLPTLLRSLVLITWRKTIRSWTSQQTRSFDTCYRCDVSVVVMSQTLHRCQLR